MYMFIAQSFNFIIFIMLIMLVIMIRFCSFITYTVNVSSVFMYIMYPRPLFGVTAAAPTWPSMSLPSV